VILLNDIFTYPFQIEIEIVEVEMRRSPHPAHDLGAALTYEWADRLMMETEGIARGRSCGNEVRYCRPQRTDSAHELMAALFFTAEAPRGGAADFGAEKEFLIEARRLFRTMLKALPRRGNSRNSLNTTGRMNQVSGSARPQVEHNLA